MGRFQLQNRLLEQGRVAVKNLEIEFIGDIEEMRWETLFTKEPETIEWLGRIPDNSLYVDVGSNIGVYVLLAYAMGVKSVIAIEPYSRSMCSLLMNMRKNAVDSILPLNVGLFESNRLLSLSGRSMEPGAAEFAYEDLTDISDSTVLFIDGRLVADLAIASSNGPISLKLDVDGGEIEALESLQRVFVEKRCRSAMVETSIGTTEEKVVSMMSNWGYSIDSFYEDFSPHSNDRRRLEQGNVAKNIVFIPEA